MLDPWYERNTLSLLNLPASVVCQVNWFIKCNPSQSNIPVMTGMLWIPMPLEFDWSCLDFFFVHLQQTSKTESDSYDGSYEQRLPILADLVLYYCRYAARPALIQLYQAEVRHTYGANHTHTMETFGITAGFDSLNESPPWTVFIF